ncbi:MAG TPA: tetratricopeptide repeat protein [Methylocella sp.]
MLVCQKAEADTRSDVIAGFAVAATVLVRSAPASYGPDHPNVARGLNNLAQFLKATNRLAEAEPLIRRHVEIFLSFTARTGHQQPNLSPSFGYYESPSSRWAVAKPKQAPPSKRSSARMG